MRGACCCCRASTHPFPPIHATQGNERGTWLWCSKTDLVIDAVKKVRREKKGACPELCPVAAGLWFAALLLSTPRVALGEVLPILTPPYDVDALELIRNACRNEVGRGLPGQGGWRRRENPAGEGTRKCGTR